MQVDPNKHYFGESYAQKSLHHINRHYAVLFLPRRRCTVRNIIGITYESYVGDFRHAHAAGIRRQS
ncbi:hypothetical protein BVI2075_350019 [Burkholderia vietnamiensis]|nr:hypothetical protein BVI2075_350019 [Burkholderia vietnamiensis]